MAEKSSHSHPSIEALADWEAGALEAAESERTAAHVAGCALCRLELKRLRDFGTEDAAALADAEWDRAELELQRRFETRIKPRAVPDSSPRVAPVAAPKRPRWLPLAPVAVAAVLAVLFLSMDRVPRPGENWNGGDTLRGGEQAETRIQLVAPLEQVAEPPTEFVWRAADEFEAYTLEIFNPDLESVLRLPDLRQTRVTLTDSLAALLEPGKTYLWNVQGREGLAEGELSLTAWFRIGPSLRKPAPHGGQGEG